MLILARSAIVGVALACGCSASLGGEQSLPRSTPEAQGVSSAALLSFVTEADKRIDSLHSFMLVRHGQVVGQLMHTREWSDWRNGDIWWLQSVYVHEDFRRTGVFRALVEHLRAEAQASPDVVGLRLYVEEHNDRADATYERLGLPAAGYVVREQIWRSGMGVSSIR